MDASRYHKREASLIELFYSSLLSRQALYAAGVQVNSSFLRAVLV
jgi:hypothetical protein